jgi:hypothetical protein
MDPKTRLYSCNPNMPKKERKMNITNITIHLIVAAVIG